MPTSKDLQQLLERIQLRLDESFVGIGSEVSDLPPEDLAELLNQLRLNEATSRSHSRTVGTITRGVDSRGPLRRRAHRRYSEDGPARTTSHPPESHGRRPR